MGPTGLLQATVGSDEPINLATPAQPVGVAKHQTCPEENCAPFVELDKTQSSQNPEQPLAKPDSIGEPEPPGCMDISPDLSGLTESTDSSDFSGVPSGLLQPTVSSDEPIKLATPAPLTQRGVDSKTRNSFPSTFEKPSDLSSGISKKPRRRKRYHRKSKNGVVNSSWLSQTT